MVSIFDLRLPSTRVSKRWVDSKGQVQHARGFGATSAVMEKPRKALLFRVRAGAK